jgi:hypothetical protein
MNKDKIENCTLNRNWIWNGEEYLDIITWNAAIEAAANKVKNNNKLMCSILKLKK